MCEEDVKLFESMRTTQQVFDNDNKDRCVEFCGLIVMQNMDVKLFQSNSCSFVNQGNKWFQFYK